ncbi:17243_t:CDS:2, partial [Acaulospora morrowiae]
QFFSPHGKSHLLLNMSDMEHNNSPNHISSQNDTAKNQPTSSLTPLDDRQLLLKMHPRNKLTKFDPLHMDKRIAKHMSKYDKEVDKTLFRQSYHSQLSTLD